ncbi:MAG: pyridoxal-dependent decarboxylase [Gammaproteobacteria bacterium]|jgi:glutamate/tyrosine decarboxylase-like PLP-dependent enzyme
MEILRSAARRGIRFLETLDNRPVAPAPEAVANLDKFDVPLPQKGCDPETMLEQLDRLGSPATVASAGGRFFGFVIGGTLPATLAANWLAGAWDQNTGLWAGSPVGSALEIVSLRWLRELLDLDDAWGGAFVTGATMANFTCLAAARRALLGTAGWDVEKDGLYGAPEITVIAGEDAHATLFKALGMLGLGRERVIRVPADAQGRIREELVPPAEGPTLLCLQAGNVNSGSFDALRKISERVRGPQTWIHVDAAFGLWAAASSSRRHLVDGLELASSVCTDAHKWLNVPYDSGIALVRCPEALRGAMSFSTAYLPENERREPSHYTPELSRRARGVEVWAALATLGRDGLEELVDRNCRQARRFAQGLAGAGYEILNDVVLNQVLVSFGDDERTQKTIGKIQREGTCWCGGTRWQGKAAMRISVCSWATTDEDVERSLEAMIRCAASAGD